MEKRPFFIAKMIYGCPLDVEVQALNSRPPNCIQGVIIPTRGGSIHRQDGVPRKIDISVGAVQDGRLEVNF